MIVRGTGGGHHGAPEVEYSSGHLGESPICGKNLFCGLLVAYHMLQPRALGGVLYLDPNNAVVRLSPPPPTPPHTLAYGKILSEVECGEISYC